MADFLAIDGKVLGGQGGEGVLIERIEFVEDSDAKTGEEKLNIVVSGVAHTVLKNAYDKEAGFDDLPEPLPVSERIPFSVTGQAVKSNKITFDQLNKAFDLGSDPLIETEEEWKRLLESDDPEDRSVYNKIKGQPIYFKARLKDKLATEAKGPEKFYFNLYAMAKTMPATKDAVMERIAAIKKKKEAAEAASGSTPF
jgi:hypothetical protein